VPTYEEEDVSWGRGPVPCPSDVHRGPPARRGIDVEGKRADLGLELGRELHHVAHERVLHVKMGEKHMPNPPKLVLLALTVARLLHTHK
jgi:hypothetical protein